MPPSVQTSPKARKGSGGRPTPQASAALSDAILDVAWRLFVAEGYKQLSVDAITREASVSKRTIYDRFGSREGLFEALVARASARWSAQAGEVYLAEERGEWLEPLIGHILVLMAGRDFLALDSFLLTEGQAFPQIAVIQAQMAQGSAAAFADYLVTRIVGYPEGEAGFLLARSLLALISGWARTLVQANAPIDEAARTRVFREVRAILDLYGCGPLISQVTPGR